MTNYFRFALLAAVSAASLFPISTITLAQQPSTPQSNLPPVVVDAPKKAPAQKAKRKAPTPQPSSAPATAAAPVDPVPLSSARGQSLTTSTEAEARARINLTPGAVDVVPTSAFATSSPATTVKDAFDYVPGVLVRPSEGDNSNHVSIRGSGLSRNGDIRGIQFLMDGLIPLGRATGDTSFEDLDPAFFRYMEVYKGANGLQYGANGLGGAVNFVSPTGYDSKLFGVRYDFGSFGLSKLTVNSGGVAGPADYFVTVSRMEEGGYRDHSDGEYLRAMANLGLRLGSNAETRFYVNANETSRASAGSLTKANALTNPTSAFVSPGVASFVPGTATNGGNDNVDWNIRKITNSYQVANKSTVRLAPGTFVDFGAFYANRNYDSRVFNVITTNMDEWGGFVRLVNDGKIGMFRNRFVAGINEHDGNHVRNQFFNVLGQPGALRASADLISRNTTLYAENAFYVLPSVSLVAGVQQIYASREQQDRFLSDGNASGKADYSFLNPKFGVVWDVTKQAQLFANVSKSAEAPTFSEITITNAATTSLKPQKATTYELGTRGSTPDFKWQIALFRSDVKDEFQCITATPNTGFCTQVNIPESVHQGVELGGSLALFKGIFATGSRSDAVWLNAAFTYSDFRFDGNAIYGNNQLPGQPRHQLRAELLYKHPGGVYFGPNVEWLPDGYYVDNFNTQKVDGYTLLGSKIGFDDGGKIAAYIEARNLTDERYISAANVASFANAASTLYYPGNGRAIYSGIQFRW